MGDLNFDDQVKIGRNLQRIAKLLDKELTKITGKRVPWSLYTWGGHRCQYVSNSPRDDTKAAMQECLDRWNEPQDPPPHDWKG